MISDKMAKALNGQINLEMYASYHYLSMSAYFLAQNLTGFANWMRVQAQEETLHAMKIFDFIDNCDGEIELQTIKAPPQTMGWPPGSLRRRAGTRTKRLGAHS